LLAKTRAILPFAHIPSPLALVIAKIRHTRYSDWRLNLSLTSSARFLQFPQRNWPFPVSSAENCPNFAATVTAFSSLFLLPIQDKTEEEFFLQHLQTSSAGAYSPSSGFSRI